EFLGSSVPLVLVTIPSDVSRGVVSRSIAALGKAPNRLLGYVENMKGYACRGCRTIQPLFPESGTGDLGIPCLGSGPFDPDLPAACDRGEAADAATPAWQAILALADAVRQKLEVS